MTAKIPTALAAALVEGKRHARVTETQYLVLHEAVSLLIAALHRAGQIDAESLAAELEQSLGDPALTADYPQAPDLARLLGERIRDAAGLPRSP
jgi:hypothetical protein